MPLLDPLGILQPSKKEENKPFDPIGILKKKVDGQDGGKEENPSGNPPTQSKLQSQSTNGAEKQSWQTSGLNPITSVNKAIEQKKKEPIKFIEPSLSVNVGNIQKYEESQQMYSWADKHRANIDAQDEHSIISPVPLLQDIAGALIPAYATQERNKKDNAIINANAELEKTRKNALASQEAIKTEIPKILSPISETWNNYISYTADGIPKIDEYKIRDFANNKSKEYGVQENGMFYNLIKREASSLVTQKLIQPAVDEQLKINYKKTYGISLDDALKNENNQAALKGEQLKTSTESSVKKIGTQISSEAKEDISILSTEINTKVEFLNNEIKTLSEEVKAKYSPLIVDNKFMGTQEQYNEYQQVITSLQQKEKENKKTFDEINKEYLNKQNVIFSKANARYRRETEEMVKIAKSQYEKIKPKISTQLQKNIEKLYNQSYIEVLNKNQELRKTVSNINSPLTNFTQNLLSSLGNQIKGWGVSSGLESMVTFGENLQETYAQDVTEFKSVEDYLDLQKIAKFSGSTTGSMLPGMAGAAAVTYASGGANAPLAWQLISGGLTQWAAETMATAGNIKSDILAQTGDIAAANNAERQTIQFQKDILPLYSASGLPFIGKGVSKFIGKLSPATLRATSPTIAKIAGIAENKFVAPLLGGLAEVTEEIPQGYTQNLSEEAIRKEGSYANMWDYHTKEKLQNTVLNVAPMLLFGGVGELVGQSEEDKKQYALQQAAKSFALKTDFASLAPGQKQQFLFDVIQRQGAPFAAAYLTSAYGSGQMDKVTFEGLQQTYAKQVELLGKTEELGLTPVQSKLYNAFSTYYENEKQRFDETQDPILKSIAAARMAEYENALTSIGLKKEPNYSVITYPDNTQMVFMHSELQNALNQPAFAQAVVNGDIKVGVFGESEKLNTKIEEIKKSLVTTKEEEQLIAKEQEANTKNEIANTYNVEIQDNADGVGVDVKGLGSEEQTEQAKQALRDAGINLREDDTENVTGLPSQIGEGQTVVQEQSQQGAGTETTGTGGVLQTQGVSGEVQGVGQEQVVQATASPTVINVSNKTELDGLQQRTQSDKNKSAVLESAKKAIATLKSVFPDMDIFIHEDADSFNQTVVPRGGVKNSRGNFAFERDKNDVATGRGRIDINLSNASETTVAHEVTHAVLLKAFGDNPATFKQFRDRISPILRADLNEELLSFEKMYAGQEVAPEEYLTQLSALLSKGAETVDYKPSTLKKIAAVINEFVAKITGGKFQPFKGEANFKNFVDFLNQMSSAIREGNEINLDIKDSGDVVISNVVTLDKLKSKSDLGYKKHDVKWDIDEKAGIVLNVPKDKKSMYDVVEKSGGAVVVINSDATGIGLTKDNDLLQGGIGYTFIDANVLENIGFAASSDNKIGGFYEAVMDAAKKRDAEFPEMQGKPVAVFVMVQTPSAMFGNSYAAEYFGRVLNKITKSKLFDTKEAKKELLDFIQDFKVNNKTGAKYSNSLDALSDLVKKSDFTKKESIQKLVDLLISNRVNEKDKSAKFGFDIRRKFFVGFGTVKKGDSARNLRLKLKEEEYNHQDFIEEFGDKNVVDLLEGDTPGKKQSDGNFTLTGFYVDPYQGKESFIKNSKKGTYQHKQFNSKFYGVEPFVLDGKYYVDKMFPEARFVTESGLEVPVQVSAAGSMYPRTQKSAKAIIERAKEQEIKSKSQLSEKSNDEDIVSASVNVAPLYSTKVSNIEQAAQIHNSDFYQEYKKENERIAGLFNLKVESQLDGIGGYEFSNGQAVREATTIVNVTGKFSDIVNYAATIGALAPEVQDATIAGMYVEEGSANHTADKIEIKIDNSDAALKAVTDAGFDRAGFTLIDGEISFFNVLDYPTKDFKEKIITFVNKYKEYGGQIIERKKHAVRSEYIDNVRRREILGRIAKSPLQYGQDRAGLRDALATAKERNTTYTTWKYLDKSESVKEYRILRQKQFDLASEGKSLSDKDSFRIAELEKRLSKILSATFKSESSIYDNAKLEIDAIAEDVAKLTEGGFRSEFPVKRPNRAAIKSVRWYDVQPNLLGDGARTNIIVNTDADADYLFNEIDKRFSSDLDRKERENTELGYPKRLIEIRTRNGKTAEIQVITPQGYLAKDGVSRFPKDAKEKAEQSLQEVRDRLGWQIPDGVGHYFYEINRDFNVQKNLRDQAKEISIKYYDAFLNTDSKLSDAEFRKDISEFKQKVDTADKSKWDEGNTGKSPDSLNKYLGDNDGNMVSRSQKEKVDFGEGQEDKDNKKEFDKLTSTMPNSGEVTKYLSGETIEKYEGEVPRNEQEVVAQQLRPALERGVNIIEKAKELFGDNYVESLLQYVETENLPPANKALIYVSLENEVAKQKLENPSEAAKIEKMQDLVRAKSQAFLRSNSLAINMGRLRRFAEVGYDVNKLTDRFFSSREIEDKKKIEDAVQATADDINKEAERIITEEENIKAKIDEGVKEEIQKIYENLSTDKKKTVDKRLSVLDKIKQNLFNKYTFKSKPQLSEESLKSKSSINNIIEDGYNKIFNAMKAGVDINKAIEIGIDYIKAETEKSTGVDWKDEADFRNDITQEFTSQGLIDTKAPIKGKTPVDRLKQAKQRVRAKIESLKEQIDNKERTKPKDKLKPDAELEALIKQKNALTEMLNKYVPKEDAYTDEKNAKAAKAKLEKEILELDKQIQKGEKDKFDKKKSQENSDLDVLRAEKEARQVILEALDPTPRLFIENALIEQGFGRQINVKTKNGVEQRWVLDWKKLAGEEGSVDNIKERIEAALRDKGYTEEQILRMQDAFVEEYIDLNDSIADKALKEINERNKKATTPEQKSAVRKLVEMYNYGLFDKDPSSYETALAKTVGLTGLSLQNFERVKELGEALSNLFNSKFEDKPLNENQLRSAIQVIEEKMRVILNLEAMQQGGTAFKLSEIVKEYMDASQRMMLNTIKQGIENPISGLLERFYSSIGYAGTIPEQLNAQQRKMARNIYKEMVLQKGLGYGNVGTAFISKGSLDAHIHNMSDNELVQGIMSVAMGKTILDAVDSAYKSKITQQKFTYNLIKILTQDRMVNGKLEKGMSKDEAKKYVAEKISGQSFEDAKQTAKKIIENINTQAGKKIFNDSPEFVSRLATDIVNAALINGGRITEEMVTASYNAAYKAAGRGLGHVANNPISEQINTISGKLESRISDAIKQKKFAKATYLNLYSIFYRNIANPFVGGGTNWIVLKAEKSGLGLISGLISMYKDRGSKMDLMTETGMKELEDAMYNSMKTKDKFIRGAVGGAVTALAFMLIKATAADDEYEKWIKKNQWAKKYLTILTPEIMLAMLAAKESGATKKYLESSFNKNEAFDKGGMAIKAVTYLSAGEKEKAAGQAGQLAGASIGNPIPWRLVRDGQQIWVGATGGEPYAINPISPNTFMEGYLKGGFIDYLGYAPTSEDKSTIVAQKEFNSPEYKEYKDKEIEMPKIGDINSYEIPVEIRESKKMTEEEYDKFSKSVKEYELNGWIEKDEIGRKEKHYGLKNILNEKWRIKEKGKMPKYFLGKDLPKDDLQNKVNQLHKDAIEKAKKDLGFISSKKHKREVTHK